MKVAIYTRVSTKLQNNSSQILALQQYAEEKGWDYDLYSDVESARKTRPLKQKIMNLIREGIKYDAIVVWSLDRWARNTTELLQNINELQLKGVNFITVNNNFDLQQSGTEALKLLSSFYEFELKVISERTKLGIKRAKQEGKQIGRPIGRKDNAKRNNFKYLVRQAIIRRDKDESNGIYNSLLSYFDKDKFNNLEDLDAIIKLDYQERTNKFDDKLEYSSVMSWLREDDGVSEKKNDNKTIYKLSPEEMNRIINFSQFIITTRQPEKAKKNKKDEMLTKNIEKYMAEFAVSKHYGIPFRDKDIYDVEGENACLIVNGKKLLVKESLNRFGCLLVKKSELRTINAPDAVMFCVVNPSQSYVKIVGFEKTTTIKKLTPEYVSSKIGMIYRIEQKDLKPVKIPVTSTAAPGT